VFSDGLGYVSLVLDTQGQPAGAYTLQVLANGTPIQVSFNLDASAPLVKANNGGVYVGMAGAAAKPTPWPSPTSNPNATPAPALAPQVDQVIPNTGDRAIPVRVDIYGAHFQPGAVARLSLAGGDIPALETLYISGGHLQATWPGGLLGTAYTVAVLNPDWSRGELEASYLPMDVAGAEGSDLYGFDYELGAPAGDLEAGANVNFGFILRRVGGTALLNDIPVRFYWGDAGITNPVTQGTLMGEVNIPTIAPNQWALTAVNYPAPPAGTYQLFAVIDPANQVAEVDETNNTVRSWFTVIPAPIIPPADSLPPVVDEVTVGGLWTSSAYTTLNVSAHDNAGGSGVAWVYIFTWEYFPGLRDWLVTNESGWLPYSLGAASQSYWINFGYFEGPRFFSVYVADQAENASLDASSAMINYIKPDNFIFPDESHLFAFPLLAGDSFSANLQNEYPDNDADLYLWPPDYPGHAYWASATPGSATEILNVSIPIDGWYWLEVYGYDFSYYNLTLGLSALSETGVPGSLPPWAEGVRPRTTPLALAEDQPSYKAILPVILHRTFLPLATR